MKKLHTIAGNSARALANQQVIWPYRIKIPAEGLETKHHLLRGHTKKLKLVVKHNGDLCTIKCGFSRIRVKDAQFFRLTTRGSLSTVADFYGNKPHHHGAEYTYNATGKIPSVAKSKSWRRLKSHLVQQVKKSQSATRLINKILTKVLPGPKEDLTYCSGVTFRLVVSEGQHHLECYDHGGIFDYDLNAEGITYPPQVAGNYYADAYSALLFLELYILDEDPRWLEYAKMAWVFTNRIYPNYAPAKIAWHHSDFKNAAILEVHLKHGAKDPFFLWQGATLVQDWYEPTNVFALRVHWKSAFSHTKLVAMQSTEIFPDLEKVAADQTQDGLFHDNIEAYQDAHDLTYHQYSLACLGQASAHNSAQMLKEIFLKGVLFSLKLTGPKGEPAYVGRASNNLHQSASAILAMAIAYDMLKKDNIKPQTAEQLITAIDCIASRIASFQKPLQCLPTALNEYEKKRVAWNHCSTPYNALTGYFLVRALAQLPSNTNPREPLPLARKFYYLADDAGYACIATENAYMVIFSGCEESYGWSELKHKTGNAGIALIGFKAVPGYQHPCLDYNVSSDMLVSDLPAINGQRPNGRGKLAVTPEAGRITLWLDYGGASLKRDYELRDQELLISTEIINDKAVTISSPLRWPVLRSSAGGVLEAEGTRHTYASNSKDGSFRVTIETGTNLKAGALSVTKSITNPKGMAAVIAAQEKRFSPPVSRYDFKVVFER